MFGIPLVKTVMLPEVKEWKHNRFHRQKRLQKKYDKKYGMTAIKHTTAYQIGNTIYLTPSMYEELKKSLPKVESNYGY
jgi:hypothetical protein